jgi:hypothetical protein
MNRKQRRKAERLRKKGDPEQRMSDQINLFHKIPDKCDACLSAFDKTNPEMVFSWNVVVREETVRLFCPDCIGKAKELIYNQGGENGTTENQ